MTKLTPFATITLGALLTFSGVSFAEESSAVSSSTVPKNVRNLIQDINTKRTDLKADIKDVKEGYREKSVDLRQDTKERMTVATSSGERREIEKNAIEKRKEIIGERQASTTVVREQQKKLARQHLGIIVQRYGIVIKQFENLSGRIQSRIDKLKGAGIDASTAESALATANTLIAQVKTDVQTLKDLVTQVSAGTDAKTIRAQVEAAVKKADASIRSAHKALERAAKALVALARSQRAAATSTKEDNQ
ncbi:MAG: hypothetical protein Q7S75_02515 [bacterium]|nr:hypothetical protein [bacterium]